MELLLGLFRRPFQRLGALALLGVLDLFLGLPEEQIGADGGAEHGDHHGQVVGLELQLRPDHAVEHRAPGHMHHQGHGDIGEQGNGQPLQHRDVARVAGEHLQQGRHDAEQDHIEQGRSADHQLQGGAHGAQVRAEVDDVGHYQQGDQGIEHRHRVVLLEVAGDAPAGDTADAGADLLDGAHQGPAEQQGPAHLIAELGAGLAVGGDAAGIVVRGPGDQAGPHDLEQGGLFGLLDVIVAVVSRRQFRLGHRSPLSSTGWRHVTPGPAV